MKKLIQSLKKELPTTIIMYAGLILIALGFIIFLSWAILEGIFGLHIPENYSEIIGLSIIGSVFIGAFTIIINGLYCFIQILKRL